MIKDIKELSLPDGVTLSAADVIMENMGERTITAQVSVADSARLDTLSEWAVEFKGEKYVMPVKTPPGERNETTISPQLNFTFQHWAQYELKRWYFSTMAPIDSDTAVADKYIATMVLNLADFCTALQEVLDYHFNGKIIVNLNPDYEIDASPTGIEISYSYIWNVLLKMAEVYQVGWEIAPSADNNNTQKDGERYEIRIGYDAEVIDHVFKHGFEGGLMKIRTTDPEESIYNIILGRGGERNLPYRYFKQTDGENDSFSPDPDWIPELKDIYFSELRGATFRSYIQGWNARHYHRTSVNSADKAYAPWAWERGYHDEKFDPTEFVADEFTKANNGYYVVKGSSIDRYGKLMNGLENNEDIYPTIQGMTLNETDGRVDEAVLISPITKDPSAEEYVEDPYAATFKGVDGEIVAANFNPYAYKKFTIQSVSTFKVEPGARKSLEIKPVITGVYSTTTGKSVDILGNAEIVESQTSMKAINVETGESHSVIGIPEGTWRYYVEIQVHNLANEGRGIHISTTCEETQGSADLDSSNPYIWEILVKNIWGTEKEAGESDADYANRVWVPILGDKEGNEAMVVFSDGWLSTSEDYEFKIVEIPKYEVTKCEWTDALGVKHSYMSHWRIKLSRCEADLESTGLYVPSTKRQANAGDHFFFIGIDMPHLYVVKAEERLDDWKKEALDKYKEDNPTWAVTLDKVRLFREDADGVLADHIRPGAKMRISDPRFIGDADKDGKDDQMEIAIKSVAYRYTAPDDNNANILPDVEIVLSDEFEVSGNPISLLQGDVKTLGSKVNTVNDAMRTLQRGMDRAYLRKDGNSDKSYSPTEFLARVALSAGVDCKEVGSFNFASGLINGAGWGAYTEPGGDAVIETDVLKVRKRMEAVNLIINQIEARGGISIESAARAQINSVVVNSSGNYQCFFDTKDGTVSNLFLPGDIAYCSRFTADNLQLKYYKRLVTEIGDNYVVLASNGGDGDGVPEAEDVIVQFGSVAHTERQYAKINDVIGGVYTAYLGGLNSPKATGFEYFFVGLRNDTKSNGLPRLFIGSDIGDYLEYANGKLTIKGVLSAQSSIGDETIESYISTQARTEIDKNVLYGVEPSIDAIMLDSMGNAVGENRVRLSVYKNVGGAREELTAEERSNVVVEFYISGLASTHGEVQLNANGTTDYFVADKDTYQMRFFVYFSGYDDDPIGTVIIPVIRSVDNMVVSARNLLSNSEYFEVGYATVNYHYIIRNLNTSLRAGDHIAISVEDVRDLRGTATKFMMFVADNSGTEISERFTFNQGSDSVVVKINKDAANPRLYIYSGVAGSTAGSNAAYSKVMVVKGTIPMMQWSAAPEDLEASVSKLDYLREAIADTSTINGGLMLASLISLGQHNASFTSQTTWSGINGVYKPNATGQGIAIWSGGDMIDKADYYDWNAAQGGWQVKSGKTPPERIAKSVDRMDGSGYRAGGNLWWDVDGNTTFVGDIIARGTFRGLRRRAYLQITSENYSEYLRQNVAESLTSISLEATGGLVCFTFRPSNPIQIPSDDIRLVGEYIVIVNESGGNLNLRGNFRPEDRSTTRTTMSLANGYMIQMRCEIGNSSTQRPTMMWTYEVFEKQTTNIPLPDTSDDPLTPYS